MKKMNYKKPELLSGKKHDCACMDGSAASDTDTVAAPEAYCGTGGVNDTASYICGAGSEDSVGRINWDGTCAVGNFPVGAFTTFEGTGCIAGNGVN